MNLTKNFKESEFRCKHCGDIFIDYRLPQALQKLRDLVNEPIYITSGYRCKVHNKNVGGEKDSQHLLGKAADIYTEKTSIQDLYKLAETIPEFANGGIGIYPEKRGGKGILHVDVRGKKARW